MQSLQGGYLLLVPVAGEFTEEAAGSYRYGPDPAAALGEDAAASAGGSDSGLGPGFPIQPLAVLCGPGEDNAATDDVIFVGR